MPLALTKKALAVAERRLRRACREVRHEWTPREQRHRRLEAFELQMRLAAVMGLRPVPVAAPTRAHDARRPTGR
ncbi:hypothetical protein Pla108_20820 [Botrimarina colliarenosi]|uniref:Uncharacterized protein n=1 Tax=Botrimarina colliarenosi TaxID=2528001 RepID=A0A5C6AF31_9BACT|nr:hypothetical protein [Botrimarina colliarenosi]TWT97928.1 hypothetical protein Pla108_20820 [Botrimarina colliarenosi]